MAFTESFLDEIRARISVSEIVGKHVKLNRKSRGEHLGLCPFHEEKTPSFTVNDIKGFYHCFGCGAHGSAFDFVMKTDGLEFPEAVERLASQAGLAMPASSEGLLDKEQRLQRERILELMKAAMVWFKEKLNEANGDKAREYLQGRGILSDSANHFALGFAPNSSDALKKAMLSKDYNEEELLAAGLLARKEEDGKLFDRFRHRIIFPISDRRGKIVGFGGRTLGSAQAKYLNSPETALFHKGTLLYNFNGARSNTKESGTVIVVEGYTDVISLWQSGILNAVAPLGTALTESQMRDLWRLTKEPVLCLDGDSAGMRAAIRAAENALPLLKPGYSLKFAFLPAGEDPDSFLRKEGKEAFNKFIDKALPLSEVIWRSLSTGDLSTPERRAGLRKRLFELVDTLRDTSIREFYQTYFNDLLNRSFGASGVINKNQRSGVVSRKLPGPRAQIKRKINVSDGLGTSNAGTAHNRERVLLITLLNHPEILGEILEVAASVEFKSEELGRLYNQIIDMASKDNTDRDILLSKLNEAGNASLVENLTRGHSGLVERFTHPGATREEALAGWFDTLTMHKRRDFEADRLEAVRRLEKEGTEAAFEQLKAIKEAESEFVGEIDPNEGLTKRWTRP